MDHRFYRVESFQPVGAYSLNIKFNDGKTVFVDFEPVLVGELFGPLLDKKVFSEVKIDPEVKTLVWPNGADFDPNTLHDWDQKKDFLLKEAAKWKFSPPSPVLSILP